MFQQLKGCLEKSPKCLLINSARFSFQIAFYSLVKHKEKLMLHQESVRALSTHPFNCDEGCSYYVLDTFVGMYLLA